MPATDEDILRDLMHRCTDDVYAPAAIATGVATRQRQRRHRRRVVSAVAAGAAFATVAGVVAAAPSRGPAGTRAARPAITLTAAQRVLYHLSSVAGARPQGQGRYVVLSEKQDSYQRTSVIDSLTGDVWTYQQGAGVPATLPVARHDSPTAAQFNAMPTSLPALRAMFVAQFDDQQKQAQSLFAGKLKQEKAASGHTYRLARPESATTWSSADKVFEQATIMLWNPLVGPALRSALFRLLAATPGVTVDTRARDSLGRPAVKISRFNSVNKVTDVTFEDPATTNVLETLFLYPPGFSGAAASSGSDLYLSVRRIGTVPGDPYRG
jgi:hypothetical protein